MRLIPQLVLALVMICTSCGCASLGPVPVDEHTVYSPVLGWNFTKLPNWEFVSQRETREAQKHFRSQNQTLNFLVYQDAVVPLLCVARKHRGNSDYQPGLTIVRESLGEDRFASNEKVTAWVLGSHQRVLQGAKQIGPIYPVKVGGLDFAHVRFQFPLVAADGRRFTVETLVWARSTRGNAVIITASWDMSDALQAGTEVQQMMAEIARAEVAPAKG